MTDTVDTHWSRRKKVTVWSIVVAVLGALSAMSYITSPAASTNREDHLISRSTRTSHLSDYLKVMGFNPSETHDVSFGHPIAATDGKVSSSGSLLLGTGSLSSSANLSANEYFPVTMQLGGTGYHFLVPGAVVRTQSGAQQTRLVLNDIVVNEQIQDIVSCHQGYFRWDKVTCKVTKVPLIDPDQLKQLQKQGLSTVLQQHLRSVIAPAGAVPN